jgi:methyl-accepting chemotaxis protein
MKIKWKITLALDLLLVSITVLITLFFRGKITDIVSNKTLNELDNYSSVGQTLLDTYYPGEWRLDGNNLYKGDTLLNENYEVIDQLSQDTGALVTLFAGDTRIATTIQDSSGARQVGTQASEAVIDVVLGKSEPYVGTAVVLGKKADTYYTPIKDAKGNTIGMWFVGIYSEVIDKEVNRSMASITLVSFIFMLLGSVVAYFIGNFIGNNVKLLKKDIGELENGNFNIQFISKRINRKDELGDIVRSFIRMQDHINSIITSIKEVTEKIEASSEQLAEGADNVYRDVEEISATTEELSAGMEETSASTEEMNATSVVIEEEILRVYDKTTHGQSIATEIKERAENLMKVAIDSQRNAVEIYNTTNKELRSSIEKASAIDEIKNLTQTILKLTAQTNLLALNASIESARAGEAGKGFAVVANEIGSLATTSKNAVSQIEEISNVISTAVDEIVTNSKRLLDFVDSKVIKDYEVLVQTGEQYNTDASTVEEMVTEIMNSTSQLSESITYIRRSIEEVSHATTEGTKGSTDIAEKSSSIFQKTDIVLENANSNKEIATKLSDLVEFFKI